jgi:hypothetical protein
MRLLSSTRNFEQRRHQVQHTALPMFYLLLLLLLLLLHLLVL